VLSIVTANGPIKIPAGPKREIPPNTEKSIKNGDISILLLTINGFKKLSINPTMTIAHTRRPIAGNIYPVAKRKITAGIETRLVPNGGIRAAMAATNPQKAGFGTPNNDNPIHINIP